MIIAVDSETTGLSTQHGACPFLVTTCIGNGEQRTWEWHVNPEDRTVTVPPQDVEEINELLDCADAVVMHNAKFDQVMLASIGITVPWHKIHDTIIAGHVLASKLGHSLDEMAKDILKDENGEPLDITKHEKHLDKIVNTARMWARANRPDWSISYDGNPLTPSANKNPGKGDMWLPRAVCRDVGNDDEIRPGWSTVCRTYADVDSAVTMQLWQVLEPMLKERGHWLLYKSQMEVVAPLARMEARGVTVHEPTVSRLKSQYHEESVGYAGVCKGIAENMGYELTIPNGPSNESVMSFVFGRHKVESVWDEEKNKYVKVKDTKTRVHADDTLNLTPHSRTDTGAPSFDKDAKDWYELTLPKNSPSQSFIRSLNAKAKRDTGISYLEGYERFWLPTDKGDEWKVLHTNYKQCGTDTTRLSSNNPNNQNWSKKEGFNLREGFRIPPGRVGYSFDAANIELRIPTFEFEEEALMDVFLHPDRGPFYGSYHLVIFSILHPALFEKHGKECKTLFEATWYQWCKNFTFCRQYGGQERLCDATARVEGATRMVGRRFPKIDAGNRATIRQAEKTGLVYTIPDKEVDPHHGYPLMVRRYPNERVSPTKPFCYHVSGTAGFWMKRAIVKVDRQLEAWRAQDGFDGHMIGTVHDELLLDMPRCDTVDGDGNLWRVQRVRELMGSCGLPAIGVPTPVTAESHTESWAKGVAIP